MMTDLTKRLEYSTLLWLYFNLRSNGQSKIVKRGEDNEVKQGGPYVRIEQINESNTEIRFKKEVR